MLRDWQFYGAVIFAVGIFLADWLTLADGLASTLYILVLVWLAESRARRTVLVTALLCILSIPTTYFLAHGLAADGDGGFRRVVSIAAIIAVLPITLNIIRVRVALLQQDRFLDMTNHPIVSTNQAGVITYWNGAAQRLYGWSRREALGRDYVALLAPQPAHAAASIQAALALHGRWEGEVVNRGRDGATYIVNSRCFPQRLGRHGGMLDIATDMTALHRAEERLRESEIRYRCIFDTVNMAMLEADFSALMARIEAAQIAGIADLARHCEETPDFIAACVADIALRDANLGALALFGAAAKDMLLSAPVQLFGAQAARFVTRLVVAMANGAPLEAGTTTLRALHGDELSVFVSIALPDGRAGMDAVLISIIDETARRNVHAALAEAQESLLHMNKMTALGEMTAVIAHQVNHPLAAIIANAEACYRWLNRAEPDLAEAIQAIAAARQSGAAAASVTAHIRGAGPGRIIQGRPFWLGEAIGNSVRLLELPLNRHAIRLKRDVPPALPLVYGDRIQIEQVLLNLLTNAVEALAARAQPREITLRARRQGDGVLVQVQDNGPGIGPEMLETLFTPFVTDKPAGIGLGLSICRSVIAAHHGRLWAVNAAQGGAVFQFVLPAAPARDAP